MTTIRCAPSPEENRHDLQHPKTCIESRCHTEHNLDLVLALADRVFALERGAVFHQGPAAPLLTDLDYPQANTVAVSSSLILDQRGMNSPAHSQSPAKIIESSVIGTPALA